MFDPEKQAMIYFAARHRGPWHWTDDGDVLAWQDGTTIAFREEIIFILEWLIPHRWPPFDALVHLLAAFRGKIAPGAIQQSGEEWPINKADALLDAGKQMMLGAFRERQRQMHAVVENGLAAISNLPADLRASSKAKATVAEMVFGRPAAGSAGAREVQLMPEADKEHLPAILEVLRSGVLTDATLNIPVVPTRYNDWSWQILHHGFSGLDLTSLELRIRTGLDAVPQPAPVPIPPATRVRQVLEELRRDAEHAGFARLVRDFMAAIQLPRRLSEQDEMPIGGFADITNRGNPDRLLLSELAHDDLTLAVRMAMNEALYLRREPPAKQPPSTLTILLDSGVRLWGVPRVLATAVAMALVAKTPPQDDCATFRAGGPLLQPVDLLSKQGVIAHLEALEPHAHPGAALAAFHARLDEKERAETVLITHVDVLGDPDFHRALAQAAFEALYLALVDRDGSFRLYRYPHGSSTPLCEAEVDIEALFAKPADREKKRAPLIDRVANPELPLILSRQPFPLLVPLHGSVQKAIPLRDGGGACVMRDRRLLVWRKGQRGARTVATGLPRGGTLWLGELEDGSLCVVKAPNHRQQLSCRVFSRDGELLREHDWQYSNTVRRVECRGDVMFVFHSNQADVRDMTTGEMLASQAAIGSPSHGRYCLNQGVWCVLMWEGQSLRLEPVTLIGDLQKKAVLRVFNNDDSAGPWVLAGNGDLHDASGQRVMRLGEPKHVRISEDGRRLLLTSVADNKTRVVDVATRKLWEVLGYLRDEDWLWQAKLPVWNVRTRASRIGFTSQGHICLMTPKGRWCFIEIAPAPHKMISLHWNPLEEPSEVQDFVLMNLPEPEGFSLKVASWPDGRRAWLDSRGMLHLRSADRAWAEVTIFLSETHMGAWATNGMYFQNGAFWSAIVADEDKQQPATAGGLGFLVDHFIKPA